MKHTDTLENLFVVLKELENAERWLSRSREKCQSINHENGLSEEQYDDLEAFTSRFARASDLLLQKVFRAIDAAEMERSGTLLDAANRAEKRGIIDSVEEVRRIRELRNEISHEYLTENLILLFQEVNKATPLLLTMMTNAMDYCTRFRMHS